MTAPSASIRVILAEDQTMVLGALSALLELEPDITVVAQTANGREAFTAVTRLAPDVLVTDIEMPQMTGLELTASLRTTHPNLQEGNGLRGMRERVQSVGGRLSITADPGVTLLIELPQTASRQLKGSCVAL